VVNLVWNVDELEQGAQDVRRPGKHEGRHRSGGVPPPADKQHDGAVGQPAIPLPALRRRQRSLSLSGHTASARSCGLEDNAVAAMNQQHDDHEDREDHRRVEAPTREVHQVAQPRSAAEQFGRQRELP
jgi:hypothetical protein